MPTPSDSDPRPPLPVVRNDPALPRAALERVLARATELQGDGTDSSDAISESRLMEIAREVGIDTNNLRQALAEERARLPMQEPEHGVILDALGPGTLTAQRIVPGTPSQVFAKLDSWMPRMESLGVRRRVADRVSWEPRRDPLGNFLRSFGMGGRKLDLVRLDQVVVSVTAVDEAHSVVRLMLRRLQTGAQGGRRLPRSPLPCSSRLRSCRYRSRCLPDRSAWPAPVWQESRHLPGGSDGWVGAPSVAATGKCSIART